MSDHKATRTIPEQLNSEGISSLVELLQLAVEKYSDRAAFTSFGRTMSYGEIDHLSDAFACYLQQETDLKPGDRLAIQLPNLIQYPVVLFGALKAGLIVVNTNPLYTSQEMLHQFCDSSAAALVIHKSMAHKAEEILGQTQIRSVFVTQVGDLHGFVKRTLLNSAIKYIKKMEPGYNLPQEISLRAVLNQYQGCQPEKVSLQLDDVALLQYTGGTTGVSKGAVLSHGNLVANVLQGREVLQQAGQGWEETVIAPLPLYHIYAFTVSLIVLLGGGHNVLIPNPRDIPSFVNEMKKWKLTAFLGLNTLFVALCNQKEFRQQVDFSQLKITASGGMALTKSASDLWYEVTGSEIVEGYGLTEASPIVALNPPNARQIGTIGPALPYTDVRILSAQGEWLGTDMQGELCVRGPQVMQGYWQRERETSDVFTDQGYLRTGDIAQIQQDGFIRIIDRAKDMIIISGFNVYPNEVEEVISSHPDVRECAVIGCQDELRGEVVKAFLVTTAELTREQIREWCRSRISSYKIPSQVEFIDELPKSNVGKVLRRLLR